MLGSACQRETPQPLPPRYRPRLASAPLTHQGTVLVTRVENGVRTSERLLFDPQDSASAAMRWRTADALPQIGLTATQGSGSETWSPRRDLLSSRASDPHFVIEAEDDGSARLRFGDDLHGRRPDSGTAFSAHYRVGNGPQGNVGAQAIAHVVTTQGGINAVVNPMPARGGVAPETTAEVRRRAPQAFRTQERAVTTADYAAVTERLPEVQRAAASLTVIDLNLPADSVHLLHQFVRPLQNSAGGARLRGQLIELDSEFFSAAAKVTDSNCPGLYVIHGYLLGRPTTPR